MSRIRFVNVVTRFDAVRIVKLFFWLMLKLRLSKIFNLNTHKAMLDQNQLVIGISVLLSFFVGYKYGLKISRKGENIQAESRRLQDFMKCCNFR